VERSQRAVDKIEHMTNLFELLAEAKRNLARAESDPTTMISHDELKRLLVEKRGQEILKSPTHLVTFPPLARTVVL
jgi:hypothetical protein